MKICNKKKKLKTYIVFNKEENYFVCIVKTENKRKAINFATVYSIGFFDDGCDYLEVKKELVAIREERLDEISFNNLRTRDITEKDSDLHSLAYEELGHLFTEYDDYHRQYIFDLDVIIKYLKEKQKDELGKNSLDDCFSAI